MLTSCQFRAKQNLSGRLLLDKAAPRGRDSTTRGGDPLAAVGNPQRRNHEIELESYARARISFGTGRLHARSIRRSGCTRDQRSNKPCPQSRDGWPADRRLHAIRRRGSRGRGVPRRARGRRRRRGTGAVRRSAAGRDQPVQGQRQGDGCQRHRQGEIPARVPERVRGLEPVPAAVRARREPVHRRAARPGSLRRERLRCRGSQRRDQRLQRVRSVRASRQHEHEHRLRVPDRREPCRRPQLVLWLRAGDQPRDWCASAVRHRPVVPVRRCDAAVLRGRADARIVAERGLHAAEPHRHRGQPDSQSDRRLEHLPPRCDERRDEHRRCEPRPVSRRLPAHRGRRKRVLRHHQRVPVVLQRLRRRADLRALEGAAGLGRGERVDAAHRHLGPGQRSERRRPDAARVHGLAGPIARNRIVRDGERRHRVLPELERRRRGDAPQGRHRRRLHVEPDRRLDAHEHVVPEQRDAEPQPQQQAGVGEPVRAPAEAAPAGLGYRSGSCGAAGSLHQRHRRRRRSRASGAGGCSSPRSRRTPR